MMPMDEHFRIIDITISRLKRKVLESFGEIEKALGFADRTVIDLGFYFEGEFSAEGGTGRPAGRAHVVSH